ncbi:hypothetical protein ATY41_09470 [Leifsonia xyli subsp. xyli]|uniref:Uncharacterized protein n=1 Tax=Leifsonia xyli subsp. xyli TaxID=59736 RepID=A0A1E2SLB4_LEIXY|nr:hypothetical protein [Leifsonia xyli]ODA90642.1 hypothetical protein ATY41_09470 [Leifsonia xyli subsp. xyli]
MPLESEKTFETTSTSGQPVGDERRGPREVEGPQAETDAGETTVADIGAHQRAHRKRAGEDQRGLGSRRHSLDDPEGGAIHILHAVDDEGTQVVGEQFLGEGVDLGEQ